MKKDSLENLIKTNGITIKELGNYIFDLKCQEDFDKSNKGKAWSDDELRVILSFAPTKQNCLLLAKAFKRGYGSIEQIFRWATTDMKKIQASERKDNAFVLQIKRIYKEMGWRG